MQWYEAVVLGVVQGLTEFIPISSTAHLRIVPTLFGWADPGAAYSAVIQLGTLLAVFVYFWKDIVKLLQGFWISLVKRDISATADSKMAWSIGFATIPIVVLGLAFKHQIENEARGIGVIAVTLIVMGIFLWLAEYLSKPTKEASQLSYLEIFLIGIFQALALVPGCSRSGSTITGGLFLNMTRESATRFSFLVGLPAILASGLFELLELFKNGIEQIGVLNVVIGTVTAFIFGIASIEFLLRYLKTHSTMVFVVYRIGLGAALLCFVV